MMKHIRFYCIRCNVFPDAMEVLFDEIDECYAHDCGFRIAMSIPMPNDPSKMTLFRQDQQAVETPTDWAQHVPRLVVEKVNDDQEDAQGQKHVNGPSTLVFSELPYANALHVKYHETRCSWCFSPAKRPCQHGCGLVYCDEECARNDRDMHESECIGFREGRDHGRPISTDVLICARIVARLRKDRGEVVLTEGLPEFVKNRTFSDQMTHYEDFIASESGNYALQCALDAYYNFFRSTPVAEVDRTDLAKMYCSNAINCFSILESSSMFTSAGGGQRSAGGFTETYQCQVGWGLYLEASRFDHVCRDPDLFWRFDGVRIVVERNPSKDAIAAAIESASISNQYATPSDKGCLVASRSSRIEMTTNMWFFQCECPECNDMLKDMVEENSAPNECPKCDLPFVWESGKLRQACTCEGALIPDKESESDRGALEILDSKWREIQDSDEIDPTQVHSLYESILPLAAKYWHPTRNLRLAQLRDRLFNAYFTNIFRRWDIREVDKLTIAKAIEMGEKMMKAYEKLRMGKLTARFAGPCVKLATLHAMNGNDEEASKRMREAELILIRNGDHRNLEMIRARSSKKE